MLQVTPSSIRQRIALALHDALGSNEWSESRLPFGRFPGGDSRTIEHRAYAVWLPQAGFDGLDRQRAALGAQRDEEVRVRWCWRIRSDAAVKDTDEALDGETKVVAALLEARKDPGLAIRIDSIRRDFSADGALIVGEITCRVLAVLYPLE